MADLVDRARAAVTDRAELPGMSLMEHLDELRKRLIRAVIYLLIGFAVAYMFHERLYGIVQHPMDVLNLQLNFTHPTDGLNLYLKTSLVGGAILASPFILYQVWLFISPGMYTNEKKYVVPFMTATVTLFLAGVWFAYHWVLPGALRVLIGDFGRRFHPIITIEDYTNFFLSVILGLGITFELPILIFFLSILGIVDAKFLLRHIRYAILVIFVIAAIICPLPDPFSMCLFATPMLALYMVGVGVAWVFNPSRRKNKEIKPA
ncbi:Sec-independent protein translocase TatC [Edaphobacter aggregans]|uniref:Sec-independent protein translocase protein TatC n=1 Tax=Edaphobacter aggregans TaxID=570835 RepID=A0A428MN61_9BACT|nr:twin-arginine translocase subunit TatC [Edaphobacter aggregans]RSL18305.1 Sec-independent protein translocase TatC [Edaphobacter aggregans]